jgi:hypothetical protein
MQTLVWSLGFYIKVLNCFSFNLFCKLCTVGIFDVDPLLQKEFFFTCTCKSKSKNQIVCGYLFIEVISKTLKKWKKQLIFMNFGMRNFTMKNDQKIKNFDVWMSLSHGSHWMWSCCFLRLMSSKVVLRSYAYFSNFIFLFFWKI